MTTIEAEKSYRAWLIWLFVTLFYCYQYILRLLPNMIMPELMKQFSIGATEIGTFSGIYYVGYISMYIPIGIFLSRYGSKIVLPICIFLSAFGLLPIIFATHWWYAAAGRFCIGVTTSAAAIGAFQIFRSVFPDHFSRMLGGMVCVGLLAAIYISKPLMILRDTIGVYPMLLILMGIGIVLSFLCFFALPYEKEENNLSVMGIVQSIFRNGQFIIASILAGLMVAPLEGFADTHATAFLNVLFGIHRSVADSISSLILIGMCVGSIVLPYFAEKTNAYYLITVFSALAMAASYVTMFIASSITLFLLYFIYFIIGFFSAYQIIILSKIASYFPVHLAGIAGAIANMIVMAFGYFFNSAIGVILDSNWSGTTLEGIRIYDATTYIKAISIIPGALFVAAIGFSIMMIRRKDNNEL